MLLTKDKNIKAHCSTVPNGTRLCGCVLALDPDLWWHSDSGSWGL